MAHVERKVVIGHNRERNTSIDRAQCVEHRDRTGAVTQRQFAGFLNDRAVHDGVREWNTDFNGIGTGVGNSANNVGPFVMKPASDVGNQ